MIVNPQISEQQQYPQQNLWVGIGCTLGISRQVIVAAIQYIFPENQLNQKAIAGIATIDTKANQVGLWEFCCLYNLPLKTFSAKILSTVLVPNPAKIVEQAVGTPSVAEAAAILAATPQENLEARLLVPKTIFRLQGQPGAVTVAVALQNIPDF